MLVIQFCISVQMHVACSQTSVPLMRWGFHLWELTEREISIDHHMCPVRWILLFPSVKVLTIKLTIKWKC